MRLIFILLLTAVTVAPLLSAQDDYKFVHRLTEIWNAELQTWEAFHQEVRNHNEQSKLIHSLSQFWDAEQSTWLNYSKCDINRDLDHLLIVNECPTWIENAWVLDRKNEYQFNAERQKLSFIEERLVDEVWIPFRKDLYDYDEQGNWTSYLWQNWDESNATWSPYLQTTKNYVDSVLTNENTQVIKEDVWQPQWQHSYIYNESDKLAEKQTQHWSMTNQDWKENSKAFYSYENDRIHIFEKQTRKNNTWHMNREVSYDWNEDDLLVEKMEYIQKGDEIIPSLRHTYSYEAITTTTSVAELSDSDVSNYPNPCVDKTTIRLEMNQTKDIGLIVYSEDGKALVTVFKGKLSTGIHFFTLDTKSFAPGTYIYRLSSLNEQPIVRKLIVLR